MTVQVISTWYTVFYSIVLATAVSMLCFFVYAACVREKGVAEEHRLNLINLNDSQSLNGTEIIP